MTDGHGRPAGRAAGLLRVLCLIVAPGALIPAGVQAQFTEPPPPAAFAIRNATVVQADGTTMRDQTVVIRSGRIEAIGRLASVPADAELITGDTLYVYPGLIDGAGAVKLEFPRDTTSRESVVSWNAPRSAQGFMPSRRVIDHLAAGRSDLAELRKKGVVAVAVHPSLTDPLMPGRGAFLLLRQDVRPQQLAVEPVLAPLLTLRGARGVYPATGMAVLQWYRQLFMDAARTAQLTQLASTNPRAVAPPPHDPDMVVVQEMLRAPGRVFIAANGAEEIRRALRLAEEFRLRPVIVGGAEAWRVAAELRSRDVPVLVNVDFPTPSRWKPESDSAAHEPAVARERRQLEEQYANAAKLEQAGVTFALVTAGKGNLRDGVRKVMEYGLSEAAALRAVTATPAALYGAPHLARLETGLPATLLVTDRPIFAKDARVLHTFVEGAHERGAAPRRANGGTGADTSAAGTAGTAAVRVAGTWRSEAAGSGAPPSTLRLTQDGETVTGTMESQLGSLPVSGRVEGDRITLNATLTTGGQSVPLTFTGRIEGDTIEGEAASPMGALPWIARRTGPEGR